MRRPRFTLRDIFLATALVAGAISVAIGANSLSLPVSLGKPVRIVDGPVHVTIDWSSGATTVHDKEILVKK